MTADQVLVAAASPVLHRTLSSLPPGQDALILLPDWDAVSLQDLLQHWQETGQSRGLLGGENFSDETHSAVDVLLGASGESDSLVVSDEESGRIKEELVEPGEVIAESLTYLDVKSNDIIEVIDDVEKKESDGVMAGQYFELENIQECNRASKAGKETEDYYDDADSDSADTKFIHPKRLDYESLGMNVFTESEQTSICQSIKEGREKEENITFDYLIKVFCTEAKRIKSIDPNRSFPESFNKNFIKNFIKGQKIEHFLSNNQQKRLKECKSCEITFKTKIQEKFHKLNEHSTEKIEHIATQNEMDTALDLSKQNNEKEENAEYDKEETLSGRSKKKRRVDDAYILERRKQIRAAVDEIKSGEIEFTNFRSAARHYGIPKSTLYDFLRDDGKRKYSSLNLAFWYFKLFPLLSLFNVIT